MVWGVVGVLIVVPVLIAATSPYLASRDAAYVIAGFAGILCLALFLIQPLLGAGILPAPHPVRQRKWHHWIGIAIIVAVALHIGGLYLTSPPDTLDALMLVAPTWFSVFGVVAMWGIVATVALLPLRGLRALRYPIWQILHNALAVVIVVATVVHALQIEGTMGQISKTVLCGAVLIATVAAVGKVRLGRRIRATMPGRP